MNLEALKLGFQIYLEDLKGISNNKYDKAQSNMSIFLYSKEFKNFLSEEYNVDSNILNKSISEILDMEVKNGKLVDTKEEDKKTQDKSNNNNDKMVNSSALEDKDNSQNSITQNDMSELLNYFMNEDSVKQIIDTDGNGKLNKDEIGNFFETIKGYDKNDKDISLEDIAGALKDIEDNKFELKSNKKDEDTKAVENNNVNSNSDNNVSNAGGASGSGSSGSGGSVGSTGGSSTGTSAPSTQSLQEKNIDNMSKEELQSELTTAQNDLSEKQNVLSSILDGSDSKLKELQKGIDDSYEKYQKELKKSDKNMAEEIDKLKQNIDDKENEIDKKDQEIAVQETNVSNCETAYNNAVSTRETLESSLSALEAANTSDLNDEKKADLNSKISDLKAKITEAKEAEEKAKTEWDEAKEKLEILKNEKEELSSGNNGLDKLNEDMAKLEQEIAKKYPEIKKYIDAYNNSKKEYDKYKETAITTAKADIEESQKRVNEVQTAINDFDNKQSAKDYCFNDFGEDVIKYAQQFLGYNEADGSADMFTAAWGTTSSATPWCAAFVDYIMSHNDSTNDVADWYKNIDNKWYCPNVYQAAKNSGAIIDGQQVQTGDIVLFDWGGDGKKDHIGIIVSVDNGVVTTIEGNSSDQVKQKTYDINDGRLTFCNIRK